MAEVLSFLILMDPSAGERPSRGRIDPSDWGICNGVVTWAVLLSGARRSSTTQPRRLPKTESNYLDRPIRPFPRCLARLLLLAGLGSRCVPASNSPIRLNEVMPANTNSCRDEAGEYDDWIELYNPSEAAVDLGGYSLSDDTAIPRRSVLPEGLVIEALDTLLLWADSTPAQGQTHLTFNLNSSGEEVVLYDAQARTVDLHRWTAARPNSSFARVPDGSGDWLTCKNPTCGVDNSTCLN
jgi:hypothetical protein